MQASSHKLWRLVSIVQVACKTACNSPVLVFYVLSDRLSCRLSQLIRQDKQARLPGLNTAACLVSSIRISLDYCLTLADRWLSFLHTVWQVSSCSSATAVAVTVQSTDAPAKLIVLVGGHG